MKGFVLGVIVGVAAVLGGLSLYFITGMAPAATSAPPMPLEHYFAKHALNARIQREMPKTVPFSPTESDMQAGAQVYRADCAVCHGLPNTPQTHIAAGLFPEAPKLFKGKGVTDDDPGETYWKVVNGIRLTGMPGFQKSLTDRQAWQVSLMLANADKLSPEVHSMLTSFDVPATSPAH